MRARLFGAGALVFFAAACSGGSSSIQVTSPSAAKCEVSVANAMSGSVPAAGASSTVDVNTTRDCTWTATSAASWVVITSASTGQGSGSITYRVSANGDPAQRRATLDVNSTQLMLIQDPAPCRYSVSPASTTVSDSGGGVGVSIETLTGCAWSVVSRASWITVSSGASGTRSATVTLTVAANAGAARSGTVAIADQTVTIEQAARPDPAPAPPTPAPPAPAPPAPPEPSPPPPPPPPSSCSATLGAPSQNVDAAESDGNVSVATQSACSWTAVSNVAWITIKAGAPSAGNGVVTYHVAANTGPGRTGTLTIAGNTYTVTQAAAPCVFSISPPSASATADGGNGTVAVTTSAWCAWTAASSVSWARVTNGAAGTGNGTVTYTVSANTGAARAVTMTIAGQPFALSQAAATPPPPPPPPPPACTFSLSATSHNATAAGGPGSVNVTATGSNCSWTATSGATWITITGGAASNGNGTVTFTVAANTGVARSGALTIAGQTFTVNQAAQ